MQRSFRLPILVLFGSLLSAQSYEDLLARAKTALSGKDYPAAVSATQQAIRLDERRWEAYAIAANAYSGQQLYDAAIESLQAALARAPEERKALIRDALAQVRSQGAGSNPPRTQPPAQPQTAPRVAPLPPEPTRRELDRKLEGTAWVGDDTVLYRLDKHHQRDPKDKSTPERRPAPVYVKLLPGGNCQFNFDYQGQWTQAGDGLTFKAVLEDKKNKFTMTVTFSGKLNSDGIEGEASWTNTVTHSGSMHHFSFKRATN